MHTIRIPSVPCARCGHTWVPRIADVTVWARCKRPYWDRPQKARAAAVSPAAARAPPCLSEGDAMAQSSRTTWLVSLLALAAVLVLHVSPAWQPAPRPGMRWEGAAPIVCTTCCTAGRCHTTCHEGPPGGPQRRRQAPPASGGLPGAPEAFTVHAVSPLSTSSPCWGHARLCLTVRSLWRHCSREATRRVVMTQRCLIDVSLYRVDETMLIETTIGDVWRGLQPLVATLAPGLVAGSCVRTPRNPLENNV